MIRIINIVNYFFKSRYFNGGHYPGLLENEYIDKVLKSIVRVKQRIMPGRHTPRQSDKPISKWKSSNGGLVIYA